MVAAQERNQRGALGANAVTDFGAAVGHPSVAGTPDKGCPWHVALRRALVALGRRVFSWRRIPLQVKPKKSDKIM